MNSDSREGVRFLAVPIAGSVSMSKLGVKQMSVPYPTFLRKCVYLSACHFILLRVIIHDKVPLFDRPSS